MTRRLPYYDVNQGTGGETGAETAVSQSPDNNDNDEEVCPDKFLNWGNYDHCASAWEMKMKRCSWVSVQ